MLAAGENMNFAILDEKYNCKFEDNRVKKVIPVAELKMESLYIDSEKLMLIVPETEEAAKIVCKLDLIEFDDYISEKYFEKKIAVLYGNCHMGSLFEVLSKCVEFTDKYALYPIKLVCNIESEKYFQHPVFKNCDLFIHQSIQLYNRYGTEYASENIIPLLKESCVIISVPNIYHLPMCFFPQYAEKPELIQNGTIFFRDAIIDEYINDGKSIKDIVKAYETSNYFSRKYIAEKWDAFINKVKAREAEWDIKIADYLINQSNKELLFYDPNHPREEVIKYIAKRLLKYMGITIEDKYIDTMNIAKMDSYEMPLHQSVVDFFQLNYDLRNRVLRHTGIKRNRFKMKLKQYIKQYISYMWQEEGITKRTRMRSCFANVKYQTISYIISCLGSLKRSAKRFIK